MTYGSAQIAERRDGGKFMYRQFTIDDLVEVIQWLDQDFIAFTNGNTIRIGENGPLVDWNSIGKDADDVPFGKAMLVFRNPVTGGYLAALVGDFIVRDSLVGYHCISDQRFYEFFNVVKDDNAVVITEDSGNSATEGEIPISLQVEGSLQLDSTDTDE